MHLKIDTGLHRNGIRPEDWPVVLERSRALEHEGVVRIVGVWSHIAEASDREDDDARTLFDDAVPLPRRSDSPSRSVTSPRVPRRSRGRSSATTSFASAHSATGCDQPAGPARPTSASARSPLSALP